MFLQTKEEITNWLDCYGIKNYAINDDLTVDVNDNVELRGKNLTNILVKFNIVTGNFSCSYNRLTSLQGAPKEVGGNFSCSDNKITSLQGAPEKVGGHFSCSDNKITSLQGAPEKVGGKFLCSSNPLITLQFVPKNKLKDIIEYYPDLLHTILTEDLLQIV